MAKFRVSRSSATENRVEWISKFMLVVTHVVGLFGGFWSFSLAFRSQTNRRLICLPLLRSLWHQGTISVNGKSHWISINLYVSTAGQHDIRNRSRCLFCSSLYFNIKRVHSILRNGSRPTEGAQVGKLTGWLKSLSGMLNVASLRLTWDLSI